MSHSSHEQPLYGKRVLLAEDEVRLRTVVSMMLEELGAEVIEAEDGLAAVRAFTKNPNIDLVLLDIRMTGMSGSSAFEILLQIEPNVRVVLSSGVAPDKELVERLRANRCGFIEKPFSLDNLSAVLCKVLAGEAAIETT
ncbi:MAG: response regulator [Myxococcota bacterium]|jgi:CheY-like chemotaxis protein|nr:response regulator [Myxococcota bacterium]